MNRQEALSYQISEETFTHDNGEEYSTFKTKVDDKEIECKLFHSLVNRRLEGETFLEYQIRRYHVKQYKKNNKRRMVWYSTNNSTIQDYKVANALLQLAATNGAEQETLKKGLDNVKVSEEIAMKTNLGTYDKKKVEEFIKSQESKQ
jgi:hypothetical protein